MSKITFEAVEGQYSSTVNTLRAILHNEDGSIKNVREFVEASMWSAHEVSVALNRLWGERVDEDALLSFMVEHDFY